MASKMYFRKNLIFIKNNYVRFRRIAIDKFKGTWILFQFLFLMQKSILYAKIAISQKKIFFTNSILNIIYIFLL